MQTNPPDKWLDWSLRGRSEGNEVTQSLQRQHLANIAAKVLDRASLVPGATVLDVGCGDGLIGFYALDRLDSSGKVIFSDFSTDCVNHCRRVASEAGVSQNCEFVTANAESLSGVDSESVDVIALRSVLTYVADKQSAFHAFWRALRFGGRLSLFEPINRYSFDESLRSIRGIDVSPISEIGVKVKTAILASRPPLDENPMVNFNEDDIIRFASLAGFLHIEAECTKMLIRGRLLDWGDFYANRPNPNAISLEEAVDAVLNSVEKARFVEFMQNAVKSPMTIRKSFVYLTAIKVA